MLDKLVTYHVHCRKPLPGNDALAYQYVLAGNGVFIRAETRFFNVLIPIVPCRVRGLEPLQTRFQLKAPPIPERLLTTVLADARRARRPDGGLNEVLYQFHHHGRRVQVKKPAQRTTGVSVIAAGNSDSTVLCALHSHGNMKAYWSRTDDADDQGARLYAVIGRLDTAPEIRIRVGVYGYWHPLPLTAVFTGVGGFTDRHGKENET